MKSQTRKIQNLESESSCLGHYDFWSFESVSDFGIRASKFPRVAYLTLHPLRLWQRERELAAFAHLALYPYLAPVQLDELLGQG